MKKKSYIFTKGTREKYLKQIKEGCTIIFEMPPFCSGDYTAKVYKDEHGLYIHKDDDYFAGCRGFEIKN